MFPSLDGFTTEQHEQLAQAIFAERHKGESEGAERAFRQMARRIGTEAVEKLLTSVSPSSPMYSQFRRALETELKSRNGHNDEDLPFLPSAQVTALADVTAEQVDFLWQGRIPLGKLTVWDGDPGLGKTTSLLDIAARVTRGDKMPDGSSNDLLGPSGVVLMTVEDGLGDTIRPRLDAANADVQLVHALTAVQYSPTDEPELVEIPRDIPFIEHVVTEHQATMVVIDPLMAFLSGDTNSHRDQDTRRALAPLARMAERTGAAVIVIRHLNKSNGGKAIYRGGGSIGVIGAARSGLVVATDPDDETGTRRILASIKSNLSAPPKSLAFTTKSDDYGRLYIEWGDETHHTADQLVAFSGVDSEQRDALDEAVEFLRDCLSEGPMPTGDVNREADKAGISRRTLTRARSKLGIRPERVGFGKEGHWELKLPPDAGPDPKSAKKPKERQGNSVAHNGRTMDAFDETTESCTPSPKLQRMFRTCVTCQQKDWWEPERGKFKCWHCDPPRTEAFS